MEPLRVDRKTLAKLLSVSVSTLKRVAKDRGPIPSVQVGGRLRYDPVAVLAWLEGAPVRQPERLELEVPRQHERKRRSKRQGVVDLAASGPFAY